LAALAKKPGGGAVAAVAAAASAIQPKASNTALVRPLASLFKTLTIFLNLYLR